MFLRMKIKQVKSTRMIGAPRVFKIYARIVKNTRKGRSVTQVLLKTMPPLRVDCTKKDALAYLKQLHRRMLNIGASPDDIRFAHAKFVDFLKRARSELVELRRRKRSNIGQSCN